MDDENLRRSIQELQFALRLIVTLVLVGGAWMSATAYISLARYEIVLQDMLGGKPLPFWTQAAIDWGRLGTLGGGLLSLTALMGLGLLWVHTKFRVSMYGGFSAAAMLWAHYFFIAGAMVDPVRSIIMNVSGN
ncbi:MAG: hypothetical protein KDK97_04970 [Verrucomicrobiales bacterium]|nr:hypothetical protein [Verrucomicrobiales bacterium]MCP5559850.1 hypothetical protein [Verrucomicrobiaceae bacterium]